MKEFENSFIKINGKEEMIFASRVIASWLKSGGKISHRDNMLFVEWMKSIGIDDESIDKVIYLATNGKLELEMSASEFLKKAEIDMLKHAESMVKNLDKSQIVK